MTGIQATQGAPVHSVLLAARQRAAMMTQEIVGSPEVLGGASTSPKASGNGAASNDEQGVKFRWDSGQGILSVQHRETGRTLYQVRVQRGEARPDEADGAQAGSIDLKA